MENNRPTGLVFVGRRGRREALGTIRELSALTIGGRRVTYSVARVV